MSSESVRHAAARRGAVRRDLVYLDELQVEWGQIAARVPTVMLRAVAAGGGSLGEALESVCHETIAAALSLLRRMLDTLIVHAGADRIAVGCIADAENWSIVVYDNGGRFPKPGKFASFDIAMEEVRERARLLGCSVRRRASSADRVASAPQSGGSSRNCEYRSSTKEKNMQHIPDGSAVSLDRTTVMIVDDHEMFQEGLQMLFNDREEFTVEASFYSASEALSYIEEHCPDVAIIDLVLPDGRGTDIIEKCREKSAPCAIVALSVHSEAPYIHAAFQAGADAYVNKASATRSLLEAIEAVRRGDLYADGVTTRSLVESMGWSVGTGIADPAYRSLSRRERQVFALIAEGYGTKEIAHQLDVSPKTIETHRASIYHKLDVDAPVAIARFAARIGVI